MLRSWWGVTYFYKQQIETLNQFGSYLQRHESEHLKKHQNGHTHTHGKSKPVLSEQCSLTFLKWIFGFMCFIDAQSYRLYWPNSIWIATEINWNVNMYRYEKRLFQLEFYFWLIAMFGQTGEFSFIKLKVFRMSEEYWLLFFIIYNAINAGNINSLSKPACEMFPKLDVLVFLLTIEKKI